MLTADEGWTADGEPAPWDALLSPLDAEGVPRYTDAPPRDAAVSPWDVEDPPREADVSPRDAKGALLKVARKRREAADSLPMRPMRAPERKALRSAATAEQWCVHSCSSFYHTNCVQ